MPTEQPFVPRPGQKDFTNVYECPVINCVLECRGKILVVKRSAGMRLHPNKWNGISGFLDDEKSPEEKAIEEIADELKLLAENVLSIRHGNVLRQVDTNYDKLWLVHPMHVRVGTEKITLDWEAQAFQWTTPADAFTLDLMPGFAEVLQELFPI